MPRVHIKRRHPSGRGQELTCGKCGDTIEHGANYRRWDFRYGGKRIRCMKPECAPRPGDLTQSKMGEVYNAQHDLSQLANDDVPILAASVQQGLADLAEVARDTAGEYEEAAQHFGGQGENQERYEQLDQWADELDDAADDLQRAIDEYEAGTLSRKQCEHCGGDGEVDDELDADGNVLTRTQCPECEGDGEVEDEDDTSAIDALQEALDEARGVADECPI